jgi:hypothetical protein
VNLFGVFTRGDPQNKIIIVISYISHHHGNIYEERFMTCGTFHDLWKFLPQLQR